MPPEYWAWVGMKRRCFDPKDSHYKHYGARGIGICAALLVGYKAIVEVIGPRPSEKEKGKIRSRYSLDRLNNDNGYWCGRCEECLYWDHDLNIRWATSVEQGNNRRCNVRLTKDGITMTIPEWARYLNVNPATLMTRYHRGLASEDVLAPVQKRLKSIVTRRVN